MSLKSINPLNHKQGLLGRSDNAWQSLYAKELVNLKLNVESFELTISNQNNLFVSKDAGTQRVLMLDEVPTKQSQLSNSSNLKNFCIAINATCSIKCAIILTITPCAIALNELTKSLPNTTASAKLLDIFLTIRYFHIQLILITFSINFVLK